MKSPTSNGDQNTLRRLFVIVTPKQRQSKKNMMYIGKKRLATHSITDSVQGKRIDKSSYYPLYAIAYEKPSGMSNDSKYQCKYKYKYKYNNQHYIMMNNVASYILTKNGLIVTLSPLNFIRVVNAEEPFGNVATLSTNPTIKSIVEMENFRLAGFTSLREIIIWSLETYNILNTFTIEQRINYIYPMTQGRLMIKSRSSFEIWRIDLKQPQQEYIFQYPLPNLDLSLVAELTNDKVLLAFESSLFVWSLREKKQVYSQVFSKSPIEGIIKAKAIPEVAIVYSRTEIGLIDSNHSLQLISPLTNSQKTKEIIISLIEMSNGRFAYSTNIGNIVLCEANPLQTVLTFSLHDEVTLTQYLSDGRLIFFMSQAETINSLDFNKPRNLTSLWIGTNITNDRTVQLPDGKLCYQTMNTLNILE